MAIAVVHRILAEREAGREGSAVRLGSGGAAVR
jgi:hypothetical protein